MICLNENRITLILGDSVSLQQYLDDILFLNLNTHNKLRDVGGDLADAGGDGRVDGRELREPLEQVREPHHQRVVAVERVYLKDQCQKSFSIHTSSI